MATPDEWREVDRSDQLLYNANPALWFANAVRFDKRSRRRKVIELLNELGGSGQMRGKTNKKQVPQANSNQWTTFIEIPLPEEAWADIQSVYGSGDALLEAVTDAVSDGHRMSVTYNGQNDTFTVSLTGRGDDCPNDGMTVVSFAGTWYEALQVSMYKHHILAEGDWSKSKVVANRPRFG